MTRSFMPIPMVAADAIETAAGETGDTGKSCRDSCRKE